VPGENRHHVMDPVLPRPRGKIEKHERRPRLQAIPGMVPNLLDLPPGCAFAPRCSKVIPACTEAEPEFREVAPGQKARCILA